MDAGSAQMRTFVALPLSREMSETLAPWLKDPHRQLPGVAWNRPEQWHFTLAFLGAITELQVPQVITAAQTAAAETPAFSYRLGEPGVFPEQGVARVLWLGLSQGSQAMNALQVNLAGRLRAAGLTLEARAFTPHLTLGRVKSGAEVVRESWLANTGTAWKNLEAVVGEIRVMQSHLQSGGARHTLLAACPLNGNLT